MTYDPKYKMKYRPPSIRRLMKYDTVPPAMVDDPPNTWGEDWARRCQAVYEHMLLIKRGGTPPSRRRGLWFYAERQP